MAIKLYQFPGVCSGVTMNALEEIGLEFEDICVDFSKGGQKDPAYLAVNPKGKVPALDMDGTILTENAAILWTLHKLHPSGGLFPETSDLMREHEYRSDLGWCSSAMHPAVRQMRFPNKFSNGETQGIRENGLEFLMAQAERINARIGDAWWYGDAWTIVDTYVYWGFNVASKGGFPIEEFPSLADHARRVRARPSYQRVIAREQAAIDRLGLKGMTA